MKVQELVQDQKLGKAIDIFSDAIELDPTWAEAWNKRATVIIWLVNFKNLKMILIKF